MTTIAWRDGVLATDSQAVNGITKRDGMAKVIEDKAFVYAVSGTLSIGLLAVELIQRKNWDALNELEWEHTSIVRMNKSTGECDVFEGTSIPVPVSDEFYAEGSGSELALGAMAMGADARRAVEVACEFDVYSGGKVQVFPSFAAENGGRS